MDGLPTGPRFRQPRPDSAREHAAGQAGKNQTARFVEQVMLGDDDPLTLADGILAHDCHPAAQQFAGGRVARPSQRVNADPLGLWPFDGRVGVEPDLPWNLIGSANN